MELPTDVLDYILSFLKPNSESLVALSKAHPGLSRIAERHRYYNIIIHTGATDFAYSFKPSSLIKQVSVTPRIVHYVRVLRIEFHYLQTLERIPPYLEEIASILPMFPLLECIKLTTRYCSLSWENLPQSFRTAVENCLHLPTLRMVHVGDISFPLTMLDSQVNIDCLSLSGFPRFPTDTDTDTPYPQLKSLGFTGMSQNIGGLVAWAKRHIVKLQVLKYDHSSAHTIIEDLFSSCSDTLNNLDLSLVRYKSRDCCTVYDLKNGDVTPHTLPPVNLSSLPRLENLTIRADVYLEWNDEHPYHDPTHCLSFLPAAVEIFKTASSLQHLTCLTLEIYIISGLQNLDKIDFSPLSALAESSASLHHIDLYIRSDQFIITYTEIFSWLSDYEGLMKLIEKGVLVTHGEEAAPNLFDKYA